MTIGTDLEIIQPASPAIAGADAERLPSLHTNATSDHELLLVWLRSHADSSPHTRRAYARIGRRFLAALAFRSPRAPMIHAMTKITTSGTQSAGSS